MYPANNNQGYFMPTLKRGLLASSCTFHLYCLLAFNGSISNKDFRADSAVPYTLFVFISAFVTLV